MELRFITKTVVYGCPSRDDSAWSLSGPDHGGWQLASPATVQAFFGDDPGRVRRFQSYLRAQYLGVFLIRGGQWICYGWCSQPQGVGPPHLPRWCGRLRAYWIFGCHTHTSFRNRGFYKQLLCELTRLIRQREMRAEIFIDTHINNAASRKGILASGFEPRGVATTYRGWAPLMGSYVLAGKWRRQEAHPEIGVEIQNVPSGALAGGAPISRSTSLKNSAR